MPLITISIPDDVNEKAKKIKEEHKFGIISEICQNAIREFESNEYDLERVLKEKSKQREIIECAQIKLKKLSEIEKSLQEKAEEKSIVTISDEIENEDPPEEDLTQEKIERMVCDMVEILHKRFTLPKDHILPLAREYALYYYNCKKLAQQPLNIIIYAKSKDIKPKNQEEVIQNAQIEECNL